MNRVRSPLSWTGGKSKQWKLIKKYLPKDEHFKTWSEPFIGGGSVFLNAFQDGLADNFILSDINANLIKFYLNTLEPHYKDSVYRATIDLENLIYEDLTIEENKAKIDLMIQLQWEESPEYFYLCNRFNYNGLQKGSSTKQRIKQNLTINNCEAYLKFKNFMIAHKKDITLSIADYKENIKNLISYYDPNKTFIYLDPPYESKEKLYGTKPIDYEELRKWLELLAVRGFQFLLTINDSENTREIFKEFNVHEESLTYTSKNTKSHPVEKGKELFITNY